VNDQFFNFSDFLRAISSYPWWQVLIELLIIGSVVYWVISFLQGTRGARLLKGIVVLLITIYVVVRLLAGRFGLQRIEFLYGRFLLAAGFAIVVVFQPELRRALMRLGETRLFRSFSTQLNDDIDALVQSATFLSRRKIGTDGIVYSTLRCLMTSMALTVSGASETLSRWPGQ
jgi:diadenylate cyclase